MSRRRRTRPGGDLLTLEAPRIPVIPPSPPVNGSHRTPGNADVKLAGPAPTPEPAGKPRRARAKARCRVSFTTQCPHCRHVVEYQPHFDREHDEMKEFLVSFFRVGKGDMTPEQFREKNPRGLKVPTVCNGCRREFVINTVSL